MAASRSRAVRRPRRRRRWPNLQQCRRGWRSFRRLSSAGQFAAGLAAALLLFSVVNLIYQVARKPSELFFPVSGVLNKTPAETWRQYSGIFNRYSTDVMTPTFLAAIAQVEASGNPVARTYWRFTWTSQPFEIYRPASSAVGMYQMTDGTFAEARHYCIRNHAAVEQGAWNDWRSCWFNDLYARVLPSDAAELTSAYLDWHVARILLKHHAGARTLPQKQQLAALIHLCGAGAGDEFARHGFRLAQGQRCGDHETRLYLSRVATAEREFDRLAQGGV
jgi:hypothetical protein